MAQFILSDEEIEVIHDALITEIEEWKLDLGIAKSKGRDGEFEQDAIKNIERVQQRFAPYIKK